MHGVFAVVGGGYMFFWADFWHKVHNARAQLNLELFDDVCGLLGAAQHAVPCFSLSYCRAGKAFVLPFQVLLPMMSWWRS